MEEQLELVEYRVISLTVYYTSLINRLLKRNKKFLLVLEQDDNPTEKIKMTIGESEATELAIAIEEVKSIRPLSSELLMNVINELGFTLSKVIINNLKDTIFYSNMILTKENESKSIDCRPADSITQAIRFNCNIYVNKTVIEKNKQ